MIPIKIGNKSIGGKNPCFIIAEAGVNHNGDIEIAKKLVDAAKASGVDAIKFQTFKAENVVTKTADSAIYANRNMGKNFKQLNLLKKVELKYEDFEKINEYCNKKNILFLSTPHSFDAIDFLEKIVPAYKFGSGDLTNIPSLVYAAKKNKPIILGTGMATLEEIKYAVNEIKKAGNKRIIVLHCTTNYPCPLNEVNMNAMVNLKKELDCLVGYSDHTMGITIPIMARTLGAVIIEKHFTLDRSLTGPDHRASLEPEELKKMVEEIRNVEKALGSFEKKPTNSEREIKKYVRKSLVANVDIKKGEKITRNMIKIKRPGYGIEPVNLKKIVGKTAVKKIRADEVLTWKKIE
jgi:N-acetylneuraminate synthase